eukprot:2311471-Alexandrium_andersonii.AAC.1
MLPGVAVNGAATTYGIDQGIAKPAQGCPTKLAAPGRGGAAVAPESAIHLKSEPPLAALWLVRSCVVARS